MVGIVKRLKAVGINISHFTRNCGGMARQTLDQIDKGEHVEFETLQRVQKNYERLLKHLQKPFPIRRRGRTR